MNRIFFWMIAIAFLVASYRELTWTPPASPPTAVEQTVDTTDDPVMTEIVALRKQVTALTSPPQEKVASPIQAMTDAIFKSAKSSVDLAIGLIGVMAFFLGLLKLAETAGLCSSSLSSSGHSWYGYFLMYHRTIPPWAP